jgi:hypothetical protein
LGLLFAILSFAYSIAMALGDVLLFHISRALSRIDNDGYIYMRINDVNISAGKEQKTSNGVTPLAYSVQLPQYYN